MNTASMTTEATRFPFVGVVESAPHSLDFSVPSSYRFEEIRVTMNSRNFFCPNFCLAGGRQRGDRNCQPCPWDQSRRQSSSTPVGSAATASSPPTHWRYCSEVKLHNASARPVRGTPPVQIFQHSEPFGVQRRGTCCSPVPIARAGDQVSWLCANGDRLTAMVLVTK